MWRGLIDGEPVALELAEVRDRYGLVYAKHWQVDRPGVQIASSEERARELASNPDRTVKRQWAKVVYLFVEARREDAPLAARVRDAEAKS